MSQLISELDLTLDRIAVIAPTQTELSSLFEELALDMTTQLARKQKVGLELATVPEGPLRQWMSFTMGTRGKLQSRIAMVGIDAEAAAKNPLVFEIVDAVFFYLPLNHKESDEVFRLRVSSRFSKIPCFVNLVSATENENFDLRRLALIEWFRRSFKRPQFVENSATFMREGMEWILSS